MSAKTEDDLARIRQSWEQLSHDLVCNSLLVAGIRELRQIRSELDEIEAGLLLRAGDAQRYI